LRARQARHLVYARELGLFTPAWLRFVGAFATGGGTCLRLLLSRLPTSEAIAEKKLSAASLSCLSVAPVGVLLLKNCFTFWHHRWRLLPNDDCHLMTNRRMPMPALESLSEAMLRCENRLVVEEKTLELMRPAVQGAQRMLGIALKNG